MTEFKNPYDAVIADLEAQRAQIDMALTLLKGIRDGRITYTGPLPPVAERAALATAVDMDAIPGDAFFGMTIVDAAIKFLRLSGRKPQPTKTIIEAFERGALKGKKYATVYGVLNRRQQTEGDIVNIHGDWGLAEWYGTPKKKSAPQRFVSLNPDTFVSEQEIDRTAAGMALEPDEKAAG